MRELTPYDTGAVLEPKPWMSVRTTPVENYGKVDFENDEGGTDLTIRATRNPDNSRLQVEILCHTGEEVEVNVEGEDVRRVTEVYVTLPKDSYTGHLLLSGSMDARESVTLGVDSDGHVKVKVDEGMFTPPEKFTAKTYVHAEGV